tara:strand:- start:2 stop:736 length:735 start_codon:yes stop_codon:yes gene_type:complete
MKNVNVIAMAGIGARFLKKNYSIPKPLISIKNKPMFYYATKSLPKSNENIFICNTKLKKYPVFKSTLKKFFKKSRVIYVKRKTSGQAATCNLATKFIKNNTQIFYSSCDYKFKIDTNKCNQLLSYCDVIVFVNKPTKNHISNYKEYGWVKKGKLNFVSKIQCKNKVSNNLKNDLVIVGSFAFKNKNIFVKSFKEMIKYKHKVNNEYYMDTLVKYSKKLKYKVNYYVVQKFKSYGTPKDLQKDEK